MVRRKINIMKLITPLWSDPVGWAEQVAKTKLRVLIWTLIHVCFVSAGIFSIYWLLQKLPADPAGSTLSVYPILTGACPIIFIGVVYPAMYLYAMHRLLRMVKEASPRE
jgi:hypothetical protein